MVEENKNVIKSQFIFYNTKSQQTALLSCLVHLFETEKTVKR